MPAKTGAQGNHLQMWVRSLGQSRPETKLQVLSLWSGLAKKQESKEKASGDEWEIPVTDLDGVANK